jgi:hypothetical protein
MAMSRWFDGTIVDDAVADPELAGRDAFEAGDHAQRRALAAAGRARRARRTRRRRPRTWRHARRRSRCRTPCASRPVSPWPSDLAHERFTFPDGFLWGAATSAYQIEGAPLADGAGPEHLAPLRAHPATRRPGETGDVACDHYHRYRDDVALMAELGLHTYRFSISWSRVLPGRPRRRQPKGLDFYSRLVDALLEHRHPAERHAVPLGPARRTRRPRRLAQSDVAGWFADYADIMFRTLGDRVGMWATLNEPWVVVDAGYLHGVHAPGHRSAWEAVRAAHNLLRAHGAAVQAYRARSVAASASSSTSSRRCLHPTALPTARRCSAPTRT